ncbi:Zinc finger, C2H2 type [Popillia japonica]|uniref:Zinc finger, C2H2 type n=1 Tax=Popillia japonica TaxID=7064 RepID=A0AAW1LRR9_POPJA
MPLNTNCPNLAQENVEENLNPNYPNIVRRKMTIPVRRKSTVVDDNQRRNDQGINPPLQEMNHTSNPKHNGLDLLSSVCATRHEPPQEELNDLRHNQTSKESQMILEGNPEAPNLTKVEENQTSNFPDKVSTSNAKQENFLRICRLCLSLENVKSFFDTSYADVSIPELLFDFTSLKVDPEDCLPQQLCTACLNELIRCYNFRKRCIEAEQILIDVFSKRNNANFRKRCIEAEQILIDVFSKRNNASVIKSGNETSVIKLNIFHQNKKNIEGDVLDYDDNVSNHSLDDIKPKGRKKRKRPAELPPFECRTCKKTFESREDLHNHRRNVKHPELRNSHREDLHNHRRNVKHPELRNSHCSICKKSFTKSKLDQHMRSHTKEKPYKCKMCPQRFSIGSNLTRHVMTHTGERPHVCKICGKGMFYSIYDTPHPSENSHCSLIR